jgi:hypothetical protein
VVDHLLRDPRYHALEPLGRIGLCVGIGVPHAMMVISEAAHELALQTPGSGEAFYRDAGEPARSPADGARYDWARLREVAERSESIEILGPPPFASAPEDAVAVWKKFRSAAIPPLHSACACLRAVARSARPRSTSAASGGCRSDSPWTASTPVVAR